MKRRGLIFLAVGLLSMFEGYSQNYVPVRNDSRMKVQPSIPIKAFSFDLSQVTLLESTFQKAMLADEEYLLKLSPDRLLSQFRKHSGLPSKGEVYGGWESEGLAGHSLGHYLSALSMHYASTQNPALLVRIQYIVDELGACQSARKTGYIGAIPNEDKVWTEVAAGQIRTGGFDLNGAWAPWYTVHKIMAGLVDAHLYSRNQKALQIARNMAHWAEGTIAHLSEELIQKMLICEYGGMAEVLTNLYAITGEERYLRLSYLFYDKKVLDELAKHQDVLPGKHANTQIPKIIAGIRRHQLNGDVKDKSIADFFWQTVVQQHTYVTGGNSNYEYFFEGGKLNNQLTDNTTETCNTYNMLKLTRHLFAIDPQAMYFDFYEKGLYNHILASQNHENGMTCYYVPLRMGGKKEYSDEFHSFTCCVGTGMENHVKYNESIYFEGTDGSLYVNLFLPSTLQWKKHGVKLSQNSQLPAGDRVNFTLDLQAPRTFTLRLRKPHWTKEVEIHINGVKQEIKLDEHGYFQLERTWKKGDQVSYRMPMQLYTQAMPDNPDRRAIFHGPILLAGVFGETEPDPVKGLPVFVTEETDPQKWLKPTDSEKIHFESQHLAQPAEVKLLPFYATGNQYYTVYWDIFSPQQWQIQQQKYEEKKKALSALEQRTTDYFRLGEMQPERDHSFEGEKSQTGEDHGSKWRMANPEGYLQFELRVDPESPTTLIATYWGMDNRNRRFDILVNQQLIASEDLNRYKESRFYEVSYAIPMALTNGKNRIQVRLVPKERNSAGPIYQIRAIREEK